MFVAELFASVCPCGTRREKFVHLHSVPNACSKKYVRIDNAHACTSNSRKLMRGRRVLGIFPTGWCIIRYLVVASMGRIIATFRNVYIQSMSLRICVTSKLFISAVGSTIDIKLSQSSIAFPVTVIMVQDASKMIMIRIIYTKSIFIYDNVLVHLRADVVG